MVYGPFDLSDAQDAELNFYFWLESEPGYDYFRYMASANGTIFSGYEVSGDSGGWLSRSLDLSPWLGDPSVWIAFISESDGSYNYEGAYVDDIVLRKQRNAPPDSDFNGDGRTDIGGYDGRDAWRFAMSNGSGFDIGSAWATQWDLGWEKQFIFPSTGGAVTHEQGGSDPGIDIYTDKSTYSVGETIHVGLDITTASTATVESYRLRVLLRTPSRTVPVVDLRSLPLPSGWSYSSPDLLTFGLPPLAPGTYAWIAMLIPLGEEPIVDYAVWAFTGGVPGQQIVPVERALEQLGEVDMQLGQ